MTMLKPMLIAAFLALPLAAPAQEKMTPQQSKMATCNKEAGTKDLKGDARKQFMSECLSAKKASQQDKMKTCNKDAGAKNLKGDARKKFMSECLSA
ncbi:MAG TPA: PsiF family protein [Burkholderiaceae bacterium]|nr:PsiF family protein [Burkholderiaceae bacterium]